MRVFEIEVEVGNRFTGTGTTRSIRQRRKPTKLQLCYFAESPKVQRPLSNPTNRLGLS
jgi:hypothetical protein